uniref:PH domain-containing protein n=1 Tax=Glossina austeni TaxID=7395 RepID=A0A1A9V4Q9_GLOAU
MTPAKGEQAAIDAPIQRTSKYLELTQEKRQRIRGKIFSLHDHSTVRNGANVLPPGRCVCVRFNADIDEAKGNASINYKQKCNSSYQSNDDITNDRNMKALYTSSVLLPERDLSNLGSGKSYQFLCSTTTSNAQRDKISKGEERGGNGKPKQVKWNSKGLQGRGFSIFKTTYEFHKKQQQHQLEQKDVLKENSFTAIDGERISNKIANQSNAEGRLNRSLEDKKMARVKPGLVSDTAALFEAQGKEETAQCQSQKDQIEVSVKERMRLFERNKNKSLALRTRLGAVSAQLSQSKKETQIKAACTTAKLPVVKANVDKKVRAKVVALLLASNENKTEDDIRKRREEDLQVLTNAFNKKNKFYGILRAAFQKPEKGADLRQESQSSSSATTLSMPPNVDFYAKQKPTNDPNDNEAQRIPISDRKLTYSDSPDFDSNKSFSHSEHSSGTPTTVSSLNTTNELKEVAEPLNSSKQESNRLEQKEFEDGDGESESNVGETETCEHDVSAMKVILNDEMLSVQRIDGKSLKARKTTMEEMCLYRPNSRNTESSSISFEVRMGSNNNLNKVFVYQADDNHDCARDEDDQEERNNTRLSWDSLGATTSPSFDFRESPMTKEKNQIDLSMRTAISSNRQAVNADNVSPHSCYAQAAEMELNANKENSNMITLLHAGSARSEDNRAPSTSLHETCCEHKQQVLQFDNDKTYNDYSDVDLMQVNEEGDDSRAIRQKSEKLLDEVFIQKYIIAQTSQALRLCSATTVLSGDMETVERERDLLVALNRRQACLNEVKRLGVEKTMHTLGAPRERGRVTVKEITLPLRQSYTQQLAFDTTPGHYLVCLLKCNEYVLATKALPTLPGLLAVKFPDILRVNGVNTDFNVTIEIYGMTAQCEALPHEVECRLNSKKKKTRKKKVNDNRVKISSVQSSSECPTNLVQYGLTTFTLREVQKTNWTLMQVTNASPLDGLVHMKVNCEMYVSVEHNGFLTICENVCDLGAWHRYYCHLSGTIINYWEYPDDNREKEPIGSIDLYSAVTQKVAIAPPDVCSRPNTIMLECHRSTREMEQASVRTASDEHKTTVRHLMSTDTKEECIAWCAYFNKALAVLRAWGLPQQ